jgi:hypothetical protein
MLVISSLINHVNYLLWFSHENVWIMFKVNKHTTLIKIVAEIYYIYERARCFYHVNSVYIYFNHVIEYFTTLEKNIKYRMFIILYCNTNTITLKWLENSETIDLICNCNKIYIISLWFKHRVQILYNYNEMFLRIFVKI